MDHRIPDSLGVMPILGGFIQKMADEVGYPRIIIGALLSLILMGMGFNLNNISMDIREMRKAIQQDAMAAKEEAALAKQELAVVKARQQEVMRTLDEVRNDVKKHLINGNKQ